MFLCAKNHSLTWTWCCFFVQHWEAAESDTRRRKHHRGSSKQKHTASHCNRHTFVHAKQRFPKFVRTHEALFSLRNEWNRFPNNGTHSYSCSGRIRTWSTGRQHRGRLLPPHSEAEAWTPAAGSQWGDNAMGSGWQLESERKSVAQLQDRKQTASWSDRDGGGCLWPGPVGTNATVVIFGDAINSCRVMWVALR